MTSLRTLAKIAPLALTCSLLAPAIARAQDDAAPSQEDRQAAGREFAEGQRAFGAGDYKLAAEQFEAAYKHKPHHASLWNAARARQRMGETARAANLYARYLREAPPAARDRNTAQSSLQKLVPRLGQLEITSVGYEDVQVDREPIMDRSVYVNPGAHVIDAKIAGQSKRVTQSASVDAGQVVSVAIMAKPETKPIDTSSPPPPPPPPPPKPKREEEEHRGWSPVVAAVGAGLTLVAAGVTVVSGLDVINQKTAYDKDPSQSNLDTGKSKQLRTNILLGVSVGLGVLTGVVALVLVDWRSADRSVQVGAGLGDVTVRGTF